MRQRSRFAAAFSFAPFAFQAATPGGTNRTRSDYLNRAEACQPTNATHQRDPLTRLDAAFTRQSTGEVAVAEAAAVAFEAEDFGVMVEPVDDRDGDGVVAEDPAPGAQRFVAGDAQ